MRNPIQSICVYCGSADGLNSDYYQAAFHIGELLAQNSIKTIYGGGKTGLMGALADGALSNNGEVVGIVPENLNTPQLIHNNLSRLEVVSNIHLRKARMSELADAFIALPGGFGTFDELFETLTWAQIGIHQKPIGLLNTLNYFDPLIVMVNHALQEKFIYAEHKILFVHQENPETLLKKIINFENPTGLDRWITREEPKI